MKGHPAHPATGALVAEAIRRAVAASGLPEGVFSMLFGDGRTIAVDLELIDGVLAFRSADEASAS